MLQSSMTKEEEAKRQAARFRDSRCRCLDLLDCDRGSLSAMTSYIFKYAWNATSAIVKCVSTEKWEENKQKARTQAIDIFISPIIYDWYFITSVRHIFLPSKLQVLQNDLLLLIIVRLPLASCGSTSCNDLSRTLTLSFQWCTSLPLTDWLMLLKRLSHFPNAPHSWYFSCASRKYSIALSVSLSST